MATSEMPRPPAGEAPAELLPNLRKSGILTDKQFEDIRARVFAGNLPFDSRELADRLVRDGVLTEYQVRRLLKDKPLGLVFGRYVILDRIGSGAMGRVYKAHHRLMDRLVAIKVIAPDVIANKRVVSRFQREMRLVGRLDHPNVVRAYDADHIGEVLYIIMEYVSGRSLGQRFRTGGPLPPVDVVRYAAQAALGLAHAHAQGIVHRDVKPSNLLLSEDDTIRVADLGLSVLMEADEEASFATADGIAVGTVDYMSPEQACARELDGRSDLYSLGCVMYHLLSGRLPFQGETPLDRLGKRITGEATPITEYLPDLPSPVVNVLGRLMASRPRDRYQTAAEAAEALSGLVRRKAPAHAPPTSNGAESESPPAPPALAPSSPEPESASPSSWVEPPVPVYPGWFRPLAQLAEYTPAGAFFAVLAILLGVFALGFAAALLVL